MFVKKLVEKASLKKPAGSSDGLRSEEVNPQLIFHHGIPSGSTLVAYDSVQKIVAVSTKDGRIKLFGKDNSQVLLECPETVSSKFLQFLENKGILININVNNHIEAWDIETKCLSYIHPFHEEITSFTVIKHTFYMFIGDIGGNIAVLKVDQGPCNIVQMSYHIPLSASHGNSTEVAGDAAVMHILPQPAAESKRVLIIYRDGFITLWAIQESRAIFTTGGTMLQSLGYERKSVTAACWACPFGSKVVVGYSNGEIFIWSIPSNLSSETELAPDKASCTPQNAPLCKLNLGYKLDKVPIALLKWVYADGASRIYALGMSEIVSSNLLQVILINEHIESRIIKFGLQPLEPCISMEIISSFNEQSKHKQDFLILLGKSGHLYAYDDGSIEKYLLQCQSRSPPSLPKEVMVKLPYFDSSITVGKFITDNSNLLCLSVEDYSLKAKNVLSLFPFDAKTIDGTCLNTAQYHGFSRVKNLYITGHSNGAINFWDVSCPLLLPVMSVAQQSENDICLSGIPLTALYFDSNLRILVSGDQSGTVRIFKFKPEPFPTESSFISFQGDGKKIYIASYVFENAKREGSSKKGINHAIQNIKLVKVNGAVLSINFSHSSKHLAVGSDQGYVSVIDIEGPALLYRSDVASELCTGIISMQFETCSFRGFDKNVLVIATKDSSVLAFEKDTGNKLGSGIVQPKKPSRALFMQILDGQDISGRGSNISNDLDGTKGNCNDDGTPKQLLVLLCSEKAAYVYSLEHVVQGVKKVYHKKKFHSSCCWASTFYTPQVGLILLFTSGKLEIRSLPELSLLKETSIRGFTFPMPKPNSISDISICSSLSGEIILVNGDQEVFNISVSLKAAYGHLDSVSQVYDRELMYSHANIVQPPVHKEKKKGIFSSVIKDITGSKAKHGPDTEPEDARESFEELSTIFSVANFPLNAEKSSQIRTMDEDETELNIDDIDLEDLGEKPKVNHMMAALNKKNLTSTFQSFKGKLKQMKVKNEKAPAKDDVEDERAAAVDQIKKKYGVASSDNSSVATMTKSKLNENLKKLQGISLKTTEMQDTARSFSSLAKEVLRSVQYDKTSS